MIDCNSIVGHCEVPIRFDTYSGCSHACAYCFVRKKSDISKIEAKRCESELRKFIEGHRIGATNWCDWAIPLHWGGVSDPFQKLERNKRVSFGCLKIFAETKYPFIVSTKGEVIADDDYLELLKQCNAVVQISMVSPRYDTLERGAPPYEKRMEMLGKIAPCCKRLIVRHQPFMPEVLGDVIANLPRIKDKGVYGVIVEGLVSSVRRPGMIPVGPRRYAYTEEDLRKWFTVIKNECHKNGLVFFCGEDRMRSLGDSTCCCGCDGLEGFKVNKFTAINIRNGMKILPTPKMKEIGTARCFRVQTSAKTERLKKSSFAREMIDLAKELPPS